MAVSGAALDADLLARLGARPLAMAVDRLLPVREDLAALLPFGGLRRGSVVEVSSLPLLCALLAGGSAAGSWVAMVGVAELSPVAAAELGLVLERTAFVARPPVELAATVVAALVDAVDFVVVGAGVVARPGDARRLAARARERGGIVLSLGAWSEAVELRLAAGPVRWEGIGQGHGHLVSGVMEVTVEGRSGASRPRRGSLQLYGSPITDGMYTDNLCTDDLCAGGPDPGPAARVMREAG